MEEIQRQLAALEEDSGEENMVRPLPIFSPTFSPVQRREERSPIPSPPPLPLTPPRFYQEIINLCTPSPASSSSPQFSPLLGFRRVESPVLAFPAPSPPPTPPSPMAYDEWLMANEDSDNSMMVIASPSPPPSPLSSVLYSPPPIASPDTILLHDPVEQLYYEVPAQDIRPGEVMVLDCLSGVHDAEEEAEDDEEMPTSKRRRLDAVRRHLF